VIFSKKSKLGLFFLILFFTNGYCLDFRKNPLIIENFKWSFYNGKNFNIFFYPEVKPKLKEVFEILDKTYHEYEKFFKVSYNLKPNLFLFRSPPEFHANRISETFWGTGGFSEPFKNRFVMPIHTSRREMEHLIRHEFTHITSFELWYGGFWRSLSLVRLLVYPIPLWIAEGIAEYTSDIWDAEDGAVLRDLYLNKLVLPCDHMVSFEHLEGYRVHLAYKQSQKMFFFISRKFGSKKVVELVKQFPQVWEQGLALKNVLNLTPKGFDKLFWNYLEDLYGESSEKRNAPDDIAKKLNPDYRFYWAMSPFFYKDKFGFIYDGVGYDEIFLTGKAGEKRILKTKKNYFERIGAVKSSGDKIFFTGWHNGKLYLFSYRKKIKKEIKLPFTDVRDMAFLKDGSIVFAADKNCQSDIFLFRNKVFENLTNDGDFEDSLAVGNGRIIYSCERDEQLDLRELNLKTLEKKWLTSTPYDEKEPGIFDDFLYFISHKNSFADIYRVSLSSMNFEDSLNLTNIKTGIFEFAVSEDGKILFTAQWQGSRNAYLLEKFSDGIAQDGAEMDFLKRGIDLAEEKAPPLMANDEKKITAGISQEQEQEKKPRQIPETQFSPLNIHKYKTKFSFDLFYPLGMFVFAEGDMDFYLLNYFQVSDFSGEHTINLYVQWLSSTKDLDYSLNYICKRWKTYFGLLLEGYRNTRWLTREDGTDVIVGDDLTQRYGLFLARFLNRSNRLELYFIREKEKDLTDWENQLYSTTFENKVLLSYVSDYAIYRYIDVVSGPRTNLSIAKSLSFPNSDYDYKSLYAESQFFIPITFPDRIFALRALGLFSWGETPELFDPSRWDRLRALPSDISSETRFFMMSAEYRFYLFREINYNLWWLIPPIFFKNLKCVLFYDTGLPFEKRSEFKKENFYSSVGFGFRLATFLFESYPLFFSFDRARMLGDEENIASYFKVGLNW